MPLLSLLSKRRKGKQHKKDNLKSVKERHSRLKRKNEGLMTRIEIQWLIGKQEKTDLKNKIEIEKEKKKRNGTEKNTINVTEKKEKI